MGYLLPDCHFHINAQPPRQVLISQAIISSILLADRE